jgi:hypothetical protein
MAIGISVNVGLNKVTSNVFHADPLDGCENDAVKMHEIAISQPGFDADLSTLLIGPNATLDNVESAVQTAAGKLKAGDLFLFTFAGHGTFKVVPPTAGELDKHDESIVLADHLLIDNVWRRKLWPLFGEDVRVVAIADCCHSGTIVESDELPSESEARSRRKAKKRLRVKPFMRELSNNERDREVNKFPQLYEGQLAQTGNDITCTRLFLSACEDGQKAADGPEHGAFTAELLKVWDNGNFHGSYAELMEKIRAPFVGTLQTPQINPIDPKSPAFSKEQAFKV